MTEAPSTLKFSFVCLDVDDALAAAAALLLLLSAVDGRFAFLLLPAEPWSILRL